MRRKLIPDEVATRRRSVAWFPVRDVESPLKGRLFTYYQDVQVRVIPYGGRASERRDFRVETSPSTKEAAAYVVRAIAACTEHADGDLQSDVCSFVTSETTRLLLYGPVTHEVVTGDDGQPYFFQLPPGRLFSVGPFLAQLVPPNPYDHTPRRVVWLHRRHLWRLALPDRLGGLGLIWLRRVLRRADSIPPNWWDFGLKTTSDFDLNRFVYESDVAVARAVREWAWPLPNPADRQMTNFHKLREHMRFALSMARIREHILAELNRQLGRTVRPVRITITGIPSSAEIEAMLIRFAAGEVAFSDAVAVTRW